jgi:hypothetical protein
MIGVDRHLRIGQKHLQAAVPGHGILQGLGQGIAGQQVRSVALLITPGPECLYDGFTVLCPVSQLLLSRQSLFPNSVLMAVDRTNQGQCFGTGCRLTVGRLLKTSAAVRPTLGVGENYSIHRSLAEMGAPASD